ncbi:MAG: O-antigen ligase family protein [Burkholderiaceae bacterium]|nr:O-antigen ligase family protein [Burkholderiaceae bacterium]
MTSDRFSAFNALFFARIFAIAALVGSMLSLPLTNTFVTLSLISWCLTGCKPGLNWRDDVKNPAVSGALLLFCWMLLSTLWAQTDYQTSLAGVWKYRKLMWIPLMVFLFADEKWRLWAIKAWLVTAVVLMLFSLEQTLPVPFGTGHMSDHPAKPLSVYSHVTLGFILIPAITLGLAWMSQSRAKMMKSAGVLLVVLTLCYMVLAQQGRTTYVMLVALFVFFVLSQLKGGKQWLAIAILIIGTLSILVLNPKVQTRFEQVVIDSQTAQTATTVKENFTSSGLRIGFWRGSIDIFKEHPILGTGIGSWAAGYRKYIERTPGTPSIAVTGGNPHQEYLLMASQLGVVGLGLFLAWLARCIYATRRLGRSERIAAQSLLVAFTVGCWFNSYLFDSATGHFFCLGLGILFAGYTSNKVSSGNKEAVG